MAQVRAEADRFYDGGLPGPDGAPPDPAAVPRIVLQRFHSSGHESFAMLRRIAYRDRRLGELLVPADVDRFRTDLTSVPSIFTWLVPRTGAHLPAALLHDGLCHDPSGPVSYVSTEGHQVDRVQADRVFRNAMADTGTGLIRRWLVWSAVTTATIFSRGVLPWSTARTWGYRLAVLFTLATILVLGVLATLDLVDLSGAPALPWMGERSLAAELVAGLAGAVVIPLLLGLLWGRFRVAGWMMGIGLAVLLHVTLGVLAITALYQVAEWVTARVPYVVAAAAAALVVAATVVFALAW